MGGDVVRQHRVQGVEVFAAGGGVRKVVEVIKGLGGHPEELLQQSKIDSHCRNYLIDIWFILRFPLIFKIG